MSYQLTEYAHSMAEFGSPLWLPYSQGNVLLRPIPGTGYTDATSCYPLFACQDASALAQDLTVIREAGAVSLTLVTDPLGDFCPAELSSVFTSVARPYKAHYLVDLDQDVEQIGSTHHRRNARRCSRQATFSVCDRPSDFLTEWCDLYERLVERHQITGQACFSRQAFAQQLALPGVLLIAARNTAGEILGMQFWFHDGSKAWHHLSGYSPAGYRQGGVSYGLMTFAFKQLRQRGVLVANLGAGAGLQADASDGLSLFKQGWSTHNHDAWLCGIVLSSARYEQLSGHTNTTFFPAYRDPQIGNSPAEPEALHVHVD